MNDHYTRRRFLQTLMVVTASATLTALLDGAVDASSFVPVGKVGDFKTGAWTSVKGPHGAVFVRRMAGRAPRFQALSAACTHKGCPVAWRPAEKHFVCPCHNGQFDANGKNVAGPPPAPLAPLPVKVAQGLVLVGG